ncbi:MAG: metal-sulfur cluster assembly factor [Thermodesulfobacteriota bacterium]
MGLGKMISGLFKKDNGEESQAGINRHDESRSEGIADTVENPAHAETTGLHVEAAHDHAPRPQADGGAERTPSPDTTVEVTENKILEVLSNVYDPEIPIDIVNLGLIYGIDIEGGNVRISMTMTAPGCPASTQIAGESKILVEEIPGVESVEIELVWDPPWDPSKMSEEAQQSLGIF